MTLTPSEIRALREAAAFRLAGEYDGSERMRDVLQSAVNQLGGLSARASLVALTPAEADAACQAISQMTTGNARDFTEWRRCTSGAYATWRALLRAEAALEEIA